MYPQTADTEDLRKVRPAKIQSNLRDSNIKFYHDEEGREFDQLASERGLCETPRTPSSPFDVRRRTPVGNNLVDF